MTTPVRVGSRVTVRPLDGIAAVLFDLDDTLIGSWTAWLGRILALLHSHNPDQEDQWEAAVRSTPRPSPVVLSRWMRRVVAWCDNRLRRGMTVTPEVQGMLHTLD